MRTRAATEKSEEYASAFDQLLGKLLLATAERARREYLFEQAKSAEFDARRDLIDHVRPLIK